ncbi:MAG: YncE family protein, partial [Terriglobales bacterium]
CTAAPPAAAGTLFIGGRGQLRALSAADLSSRGQLQVPGQILGGVWNASRQRLDLLIGGANAPTAAVVAVDPVRWQVLARRKLEATPVALTLDPQEQKVYVIATDNAGAGRLLVLDAGSLAVRQRAGVGRDPAALTLGIHGTSLLVASRGDASVAQLSLPSLTPQWRTQVSAPPRQLLVLPFGHKAFALCGNMVAVLDTSTGGLLTYLPAGPAAQSMVLKPDGGELYVSSADGTVSAIATGTNEVVAAMAAGLGAGGLSVAPDGSVLYVGNAQAATVSVINLESRKTVAVVRVGEQPGRMALSRDHRLLFVADSGSNDLAVVRSNLDPASPNTLLTLLPSPPQPLLLLAAPVERWERAR